jgi:hypothetical protein
MLTISHFVKIMLRKCFYSTGCRDGFLHSDFLTTRCVPFSVAENVGNILRGGHSSVPACTRDVAQTDGAHIEHVLKQR